MTGDMVVAVELDAPVGFEKSTPEGEAEVRRSVFWKAWKMVEWSSDWWESLLLSCCEKEGMPVKHKSF